MRWNPSKLFRNNLPVASGVAASQVDPVHLVRAFRFARHLRDQRNFSEALDDAHAFQLRSEEINRDRSDDVTRNSLQKHGARFDIVSMLIQRRQFADYAATDAVRAICVYSDASPIRGNELQGMKIDVCLKTGDIFTSTLPGATLSYGHCDAISKSISFLWAVFLIAGPGYSEMRYFLDKVRIVSASLCLHIFGCRSLKVYFWKSILGG